MSNYTDKVAIAIPITDRNDFLPSELISLRQLLHYLSKYDIYFIAPESSEIEYPGIDIKYFGSEYFGSINAHVQLMLSSHYYEAFENYEYLLIYHLDALVFSDRITEWCNLNYDYIGAPWIKYEGAPYQGLIDFEGKVGNGGFSLRKISSFLRVLNSTKEYLDADEYWNTFYGSMKRRKRFLNLHKKYLMKLGYRPQDNNAKLETSTYQYNDDHFIANRATYYYPEFNIAPPELALKFSFEANPRLCYEKNKFELPFGCHAWEKYDRNFWEPYLVK